MFLGALPYDDTQNYRTNPMDATPALPLSSCLAEISANRIPWAGDPGADFRTGLYAVLDHIDDNASALLYYRPQSQQFLLYVYVPSRDEMAVADVAEAVTRYLKHADALYGTPGRSESLPGAVLYELDRPEACRRIASLRRALSQPVQDVVPHRFH